MQRYKTHICLVSQNEEFNITPALHSNFKPDNVLLIHPTWFRQKAENIAEVFHRHQIKTRFLEIKDKKDTVKITEQVNQAIDNILNQYKPDPQDNKVSPLVLNVTGGSQLLGIICYEIFTERKLPAFYVNKASDRLYFLPLKDQNSYQFDLEDRLKLRDYLLAYGIKPVNEMNPHEQIPKNHQKVCHELIYQLDKYQKSLGKFNYYASQTGKNFQSKITPSDRHDKRFMALVRLFTDMDIIRYDGKLFDFKNEQNRFFCNGGWLEEYVFTELRSLKKQLMIQDIVMGLEIELPCGSKNELDVAFMANNRFYLIECKTKRYNGHTAGNNTLYKLDTIKHYGSPQSKALLVSYHKLTHSNRRRASDYQLTIISAYQIKHLKQHIIDWMSEPEN